MAGGEFVEVFALAEAGVVATTINQSTKGAEDAGWSAFVCLMDCRPGGWEGMWRDEAHLESVRDILRKRVGGAEAKTCILMIGDEVGVAGKIIAWLLKMLEYRLSVTTGGLRWTNQRGKGRVSCLFVCLCG